MRIVIAEDNVVLAQGLSLLLEEVGDEVVAIAGDGDSLASYLPPRRHPRGIARAFGNSRPARTRLLHDPVSTLTPREREVLELMAQGYANGEIARKLTVTERAILKHIGNIFTKLDLPAEETGHRRVLAVLAYLSR
ncbi:DNA-binding NarL/FixJ family response regulator [Nocardia sp. GAS34]